LQVHPRHPTINLQGRYRTTSRMREARARFAELLDDAERGNVTLITRHGRAAAAIVPVALLGQLGEPGGVLPDPEADPALRAAVVSLRDALCALEPLLGQETASAASQGRLVAGTGFEPATSEL
jgi:prevent-host-death family protein